MKKKIEDYLHLYLGCEVKTPEGTERFCGIRPTAGHTAFMTEDNTGAISYRKAENVKPILRPLSDMTIEELIGIEQIISPGQTFTDKQRNEAMENIKEDGIDAMNFDDNDPRLVFELFRYLLSKGFDLFSLIEVGLAMDKTKMKQEELTIKMKEK